MLLTQGVVFWVLLSTNYGFVEIFLHFNLVAYLLSTLCVAGAGYLWNDLADQETDAINKPERRTIGRLLTARGAALYAWGLTFVGGLLGFMADVEVGLVSYCWEYLGVAALLYAYAYRLKCTVLLGNLVVSFLCGLLVITAYYATDTHFNNDPFGVGWSVIAIPYALFAFGFTLLREMVKDIEDLPGDRQANCATLPVRYGWRLSKTMALVWNGVLLLPFLLFMLLPWLTSDLQIPWIWTLSAAVISVLLIGCFAELRRAALPDDFRRISTYIKIMMLAGLVCLLVLGTSF